MRGRAEEFYGEDRSGNGSGNGNGNGSGKGKEGRRGFSVGVHVRRGDLHPKKHPYEKAYLPLELYARAAGEWVLENAVGDDDDDASGLQLDVDSGTDVSSSSDSDTDSELDSDSNTNNKSTSARTRPDPSPRKRSDITRHGKGDKTTAPWQHIFRQHNSQLILASDDPAVYEDVVFAGALRAQARVVLVSGDGAGSDKEDGGDGVDGSGGDDATFPAAETAVLANWTNGFSADAFWALDGGNGMDGMDGMDDMDSEDGGDGEDAEDQGSGVQNPAGRRRMKRDAKENRVMAMNEMDTTHNNDNNNNNKDNHDKEQKSEQKDEDDEIQKSKQKEEEEDDDDDDDDTPSPETMRLRRLIARAYILDLAVLGGLGDDAVDVDVGGNDTTTTTTTPTTDIDTVAVSSPRAHSKALKADAIACAISAMGCRLLAVMLGFETAFGPDGRWLNVDKVGVWKGVVW